MIVQSESVPADTVLIVGGQRPGHEHHVVIRGDVATAVCRCGWSESYAGPFADMRASAASNGHSRSVVALCTQRELIS